MAKAKNNDALKKNLFWLVLGGFIVVWLVGVCMVKFAGADTSKTEWEKAAKDAKGINIGNIKTPAYQEPWKKHGQAFDSQKRVVWKDAWDQQQSMYTWPDEMPFNVRPLYPEDSLGRNAADVKSEELKHLTTYKDRWYDLQFNTPRPLGEIVYPAEFLGGFKVVFPAVVWDKDKAPTPEEVWLAQEDFWVRREMLYIVRDAMDAVSIFKEVAPEAPKDKDGKVIKPKEKPLAAGDTRTFRNGNWEIKLKLEKGKGGLTYSTDSVIKNVNKSGRTQLLANPKTGKGLPFRLIQGRAVSEIRVEGEPLAANGESVFKKNSDTTRDGVDLAKPVFIEQVLDWELSPVRRIDLLEIGRHSHRTAVAGLKVNEELKKLDPDDKPPEGTPGGAPGGIPGMTPPGAMGGGIPSPMGLSGDGRPGVPGMGGMTGGAPVGETTRVNKLPRQRYMYLTPQCRHLPVGMRLVVDQANVQDVLTAVTNSRLRVQITQVSLHHVRDVKRGAAEAGTGTVPGMGGDSRPGPVMIGSNDGRPGSAGLLPRPFVSGPASDGGMGGVGGTTTAPTDAKAQVIDSAELVELSIYGVASLYERYPPREKPTTTTGTTTGVPGKP